MKTTTAPTSEVLYKQSLETAYDYADMYLKADWLAETAHSHLTENIHEEANKFYGFTWNDEKGTISHPSLKDADLYQQIAELFTDHAPQRYIHEIAQAWQNGDYDE
jgi:hypothetical protein